MRAALRSEWLRLPADYFLLGCALLTVFLTGSAMVGFLASHGITETDTRAIEQNIGSGCLQVVTPAVLYGAIRYCADFRAGIVARSVLLSRRTPAVAAKAVLAAVSGAIVGLVGALVSIGAVWIKFGHVSITGHEALLLAGGVAAATLAGPWGLYVGVVVRNNIIGPMAALASVMVPLFVWNERPGLGAILPYGADMSLLGQPGSALLPAPLGLLVLVLWLGLLGAAAHYTVKVRDVA